MQDDFNSAQTPADPQVAPVARPPVSSGHAPPIYDPNLPQGQPDRTQTYHGPTPGALDRRTSPTLPDVTQWPGAAGASPYAPTRFAPSAPRQQARQPRALVPVAVAPPPQRQPAPRMSAPRGYTAPAYAPAHQGGLMRWIPLPHTLLVVGILLLLLATRLPWGVDSSGNLVTLQSVTVPALSSTGGDGSALAAAINLIGVIGVLSAALLFFNAILSGINRALRGGCLAGCIVAPLYPILLALIGCLLVAQLVAAGFGGLGGLELTQQIGMGAVGLAHYELGYYAWYTGLILNVAGMLGELVIRGR